jgi:hypothetical protein
MRSSMAGTPGPGDLAGGHLLEADEIHVARGEARRLAVEAAFKQYRPAVWSLD